MRAEAYDSLLFLAEAIGTQCHLPPAHLWLLLPVSLLKSPLRSSTLLPGGFLQHGGSLLRPHTGRAQRHANMATLSQWEAGSVHKRHNLPATRGAFSADFSTFPQRVPIGCSLVARNCNQLNPTSFISFLPFSSILPYTFIPTFRDNLSKKLPTPKFLPQVLFGELYTHTMALLAILHSHVTPFLP